MEYLKKIWRPLLAITLIVVLIKKGPFQVEQLKFILTHSTIVILGFVIFFLQVLIFSFRWRLFVNLVTKVPLLKIFKLNLVGYFFNYFIPGGVSGDIVKALELSKDKSTTRSEALSTVLSDRIFGLFAMITFTFVFLLIEYSINKEDYILKFLLLNAVLFAGMIAALLFLPYVFVKISNLLPNNKSNLLVKAEKLINSLHFTLITFKNIKLQSKSFLVSIIGQLLAIYFMYEVVRILGVPQPSFFVFFALCCFSFVASAIPIFPAGVGVGQAAIYVMFSNISEDLGKATITAISALQIFNLFYALIGGVIFSFMPKVKKELEESL
ncbi:flippase-like domain-containing protein [bacterium]|nr:flippase-like domain-containing protein [bacterium]